MGVRYVLISALSEYLNPITCLIHPFVFPAAISQKNKTVNSLIVIYACINARHVMDSNLKYDSDFYWTIGIVSGIESQKTKHFPLKILRVDYPSRGLQIISLTLRSKKQFEFTGLSTTAVSAP